MRGATVLQSHAASPDSRMEINQYRTAEYIINQITLGFTVMEDAGESNQHDGLFEPLREILEM